MNALKFLNTGVILLLTILLSNLAYAQQGESKPNVLVFTKTRGWHHESIPNGVKAIKKLGKEHGFNVEEAQTTGSNFTYENLKKYSAIVFISTTGNIFNSSGVGESLEQANFKRYINEGGGYVGIHAAADAGYYWSWYEKLVGTYFKNHPFGGGLQFQEATLHVHKDPNFPVTEELPSEWVRTDEWYNYRHHPENVNVLVSIDESTYEGGEMGEDHPLVWYHEYDGGRAFYMGMGHTKESYTEPNFLKLLLGGIQYAMNGN